MTIWAAEITELRELYISLKGQYPELEKELERLVNSEDENIVLIYARRCLEIIITDLCEFELKRPRKTEPLKGIIDKLNKEQKVPAYMITSMTNLNSVSTFAAHPKEYEPRQVRTALIDLVTIIEWFINHKKIVPEYVPITDMVNQPDLSKIEDISLSTAKIQQEKSIIVLPFRDMSPERNQDYFCEGITEEIINALTHIESLKVIARTSAFAFKDKYEDVRKIGREFNVETLLEGSVRKSGDKLRITVQLIKVSDGSHLWSEKYDREMKDIFEIQDEISLAIVDKLKIELFEDEKKQVLKSKTQNLDAYNYYLKGRYHWNKRTNEGLEKSIEYFEKSIEADPNYAPAYTGLADAYIILADWGFLLPKDAIAKAKPIILKSLELDNTFAETYASLAYLDGFFEWKWQDAMSNFKRAFDLNPNLPKAHHWYAMHLISTGHYDKALEYINRGCELDPLSMIINFACGLILYLIRHYDEAIKQLQKTLVINKNFKPAHHWISLINLQKGMYSDAVKAYQNMLSINPLTENYVPILGDIYRKSGIQGFLNWVIDEGLMFDKGVYNKPYYLAINNAKLGNKEQAIEWLKQAVDMHSPRIAFTIKSDPGFDSLRDIPEFSQLLEKMGLS
jgi:TolB-like protein/lipoprotein NlpI